MSSDGLCFLHPRKLRAIVAAITFGGFLLWIVFGSYTYLPQQDGRASSQRAVRRSAPLEVGEWNSGPGRRLLSVNETAFNCSLVYLVKKKTGELVDLDHDAVSCVSVCV